MITVTIEARTGLRLDYRPPLASRDGENLWGQVGGHRDGHVTCGMTMMER